jgi:hypothetical protein
VKTATVSAEPPKVIELSPMMVLAIVNMACCQPRPIDLGVFTGYKDSGRRTDTPPAA